MARSKESQNAQRTGEPVEQARMLYALRWLHNARLSSMLSVETLINSLWSNVS
jgi:hypothetical protein